MRFLILGAGAIGGYYGGRLAAAGVDTTFLVRPRRARQIAANGLVIKSPKGDLALPVRTVSRETAGNGYDAVVLSCKAYDLDDAMASIRPAADGAKIIPLLNGLQHLDRLEREFGADAVLGGTAVIGVTLEDDGTITHLNRADGFTFGERHASQAEFCARLAPAIAMGGFESRHSQAIMQDMWEKFVFLTTNAALCCLMRGSVGAINSTEFGTSVIEDALAECTSVAVSAGFPPREAFSGFAAKTLKDPASPGTASMLRDLRRGGQVEADHIVRDMLRRALANGEKAPMLRAALTHLQVYQAELAARAS